MTDMRDWYYQELKQPILVIDSNENFNLIVLDGNKPSVIGYQEKLKFFYGE